MLTWLIMFIQKIIGANYVAIIVAAAWVVYLGLFFVIEPNRGKQQFKTAVIVGLCATAVCDVIWFFKFFDNFVRGFPSAKTHDDNRHKADDEARDQFV